MERLHVFVTFQAITLLGGIADPPLLTHLRAWRVKRLKRSAAAHLSHLSHERAISTSLIFLAPEIDSACCDLLCASPCSIHAPPTLFARVHAGLSETFGFHPRAGLQQHCGAQPQVLQGGWREVAGQSHHSALRATLLLEQIPKLPGKQNQAGYSTFRRLSNANPYGGRCSPLW